MHCALEALRPILRWRTIITAAKVLLHTVDMGTATLGVAQACQADNPVTHRTVLMDVVRDFLFSCTAPEKLLVFDSSAQWKTRAPCAHFSFEHRVRLGYALVDSGGQWGRASPKTSVFVPQKHFKTIERLTMLNKLNAKDVQFLGAWSPNGRLCLWTPLGTRHTVCSRSQKCNKWTRTWSSG